MKKIKNKIILSLFGIATLVSCNSDPDNTIYDVFDGLTNGAVFRTLDRVSSDFNKFDKSSEWEIVVEAQDKESGNLLSEMNVYLSFTDNLPDGNDFSKPEALLTSIPASVFTTSANGLPSTGVKSTLGEALTLLGLNDGEYTGGDTFNYRLEYVQTDGRSFSAADGSGSLQGSYFQSPYEYKAGILCTPTSAVPGVYKIDMQDLYGDGWNGASISVVIDGVSTDYTIDDGSSASHTIIVPDTAATLVFIFNSGDWDEEVVFQIYMPSGTLGIDAGPNPIVGEIILNYCFE